MSVVFTDTPFILMLRRKRSKKRSMLGEIIMDTDHIETEKETLLNEFIDLTNKAIESRSGVICEAVIATLRQQAKQAVRTWTFWAGHNYYRDGVSGDIVNPTAPEMLNVLDFLEEQGFKVDRVNYAQGGCCTISW
jgi:hypothetical protein